MIRITVSANAAAAASYFKSQLDSEFYNDNKLSRMHLGKRAELALAQYLKNKKNA